MEQAYSNLDEELKFPKDVNQPLLDYIDERENNKGTWQWLIIKSVKEKQILGVHTWALGYLTPIFRDILKNYKKEEYQVKTYKKPKDKLLKILTLVSAPRMKISEFNLEE